MIAKNLMTRVWIGALACLAASSLAAAGGKHGEPRLVPPGPPGLCPIGAGNGGGGQPDPLTMFNQYVELADQGLYLLRGEVKVRAMGSRRQQAYLEVDLEAHPWLANKERKIAPYYAIEGSVGYWRAFDGRYGELAAHARVQFRTGGDGEIQQVITLRPIPELSIFPRH